MYYMYDLYDKSEEDANKLVSKLAEKGITAVAGKAGGDNAVEFQTEERISIKELRDLESLAPFCTLTASAFRQLD